MIETHGPLASERLEAANAVEAQREYSQALARHAEIEDQCIDCGRTEDPGEEFQEEGTEGPICKGCKERRMELDELSPVSMLTVLSGWFLKADRRKGGVLVPMAELKEAIIEAAKDDPYTNQYPWESGAEWDARRTSGR